MSLEMGLETPVAFFVFNRPDLTQIVFEAIARARPRQLLLVADGPRDAEEAKKCLDAIAVFERIDWPCEVQTHFSDLNLGCRKRLSSGLDWVFSRVETAIVLEDDCLPAPSFFPFCDAMLHRYADDERVMHISGNNFAPLSDKSASYGFSRYVHVWGWATWRRAWGHYDVDLRSWPQEKARILAGCRSEHEAAFWADKLGAVARGEIDTWDYQWQAACFKRGGLAVVPGVNLVSNLGFRADATHTPAGSSLANLTVGELKIERHPPEVVADTRADAREWQRLIRAARPVWWRRVARRVKRGFAAKTASPSR